VESHLTLDVNQLSEKGCLRPGCSSTCRWIVGNEVVSLNVRAEAERLSLSYTVRVGNGERQDMTETIPIVHLGCRFGGSRAYFICPGAGDGTVVFHPGFAALKGEKKSHTGEANCRSEYQ